jgi:hypothetical protein
VNLELFEHRLIKTAVDEAADRLIAREAQWLRELGGVRSLDGQVPRLLEEGRSEQGRRYLVMTMSPGMGETRAFTHDHARFLASLGKARFRATDFELSGCCQRLQRELHALRELAAPAPLAALEEAFSECETALLYWTGPYVLSQGDFAPWNVRTLGSQLFVADWERARAEANPLEDVLHYLMIQRARRGRPLSVAFLRSSMQRAREFALEAYPEWVWREQVIGALTLVYLIGQIVHHAAASRRLERTDPVVGAYWRLVEKRSQWMPD